MDILTIIFAAPLILLFALAIRDLVRFKNSKPVPLKTREFKFDDETPWYERDDQNDTKKSS